MKKTIFLVPMILALLLFSACNKNAEVKQFAADFAEKVSKNQVDSVRALYPDAAKCDSFSLAFNADSIQVAETETAGLYKVTMGNADFTVQKTEDGKMTVKESHGLFAYPADRLDLAKKTGQWQENLNDAEQALRMADSQFVTWIEDKIAAQAVAELKSKVKIVKSDASGMFPTAHGMVVVANESSREISGDEYVVTAKCYDVTGFTWSRYYAGSKTLTGKPIPAGGQVTYTFTYSLGAYACPPVCSISIRPKLDNIMADYNFTGEEYEEYQNSK